MLPTLSHRVKVALVFCLLLPGGGRVAQAGAQYPGLAELFKWGQVHFRLKSGPWGYLQKKTDDAVNYRAISKARRTILRKSAIQIGSQAGFGYQTIRIEKTLEKKAATLDKIFNFKGLVLRAGRNIIMPPVISKLHDQVKYADPTLIRRAGLVIKIIRQARIVPLEPTWRSYLLIAAYGIPNPPRPSLAPNDANEYHAWRKWVVEGWEQGIDHAFVVFNDHVNKLRRDLIGMAIYHELLDRGMVTRPIMRGKMRAVSGGDNELIIDDYTLKIEILPKMQHQAVNWRAIHQVSQLLGQEIK